MISITFCCRFSLSSLFYIAQKRDMFFYLSLFAPTLYTNIWGVAKRMFWLVNSPVVIRTSEPFDPARAMSTTEKRCCGVYERL